MPFSDVVDLDKHHVPAIIEFTEPYVELPSPPLEFGPPPCPDINEGLRQLTLRSPSPYELEEQGETSTEGNDDEDLMDVDQLAITSADVSVPIATPAAVAPATVATAATTPAAVAVVTDNLPDAIAAWKWLLDYEGTELYSVFFTKETADIKGVSDWISDVIWQDCLCGDRRLPL